MVACQDVGCLDGVSLLCDNRGRGFQSLDRLANQAMLASSIPSDLWSDSRVPAPHRAELRLRQRVGPHLVRRRVLLSARLYGRLLLYGHLSGHIHAAGEEAMT